MKERVHAVLHEYGKTIVVFIFLIASIIFLSFIVVSVVPKKLRVSFLDVGQGDAILIQTPHGHDLLIDGGASDNILTRISEELNYFDRDIEVMIATHGDADHITGLIPVLKNYEVKTIIRSPVDGDSELFKDLTAHINKEHAEAYVGTKGDVIDFGDGVTVHVLYPRKTISPRTETNEASVSVVVRYGEHSFLLTGDLGSIHEQELIVPELPKHITVFKAGHHGSKTSSGESLLSYIKPEYVVISAGRDNKYGHPHSEAFIRLQKYSKEILGTYDYGTITFVSDGRLLEVVTKK